MTFPETRFTSLIGCRLPIQSAGMGAVSTPALAAAVARAGGLVSTGFMEAIVGSGIAVRE